MLRIFISSVQKELADERAVLRDYLRGDALLRRFFEVFLFEELPEVVAEAIVNAVCHRDYTSNASVQVMLFKDRLEIWNPGHMPPGLTLEKLREPHHSVPANPLVAEPLYLTKYIERMGTGIRDMIQRCRDAGLPEPEIRIDSGVWVTTIRRKPPQVTGEVTVQDVRPETEALVEAPVEAPVELSATETNIITALTAESLGRSALLGRLGYSQRTGNFKKAIRNLLDNGWIELTIPDKPNSRLQKYRLTATGRARLANGGQA